MSQLVEIAEQVTVLADLRRNGLIRYIGLSNVTAAQVTEAQAITDIVCVQNAYSLLDRSQRTHAVAVDIAYRGVDLAERDAHEGGL